MTESIFDDPSAPPDDAALAAAFGARKPLWDALVATPRRALRGRRAGVEHVTSQSVRADTR